MHLELTQPKLAPQVGRDNYSLSQMHSGQSLRNQVWILCEVVRSQKVIVSARCALTLGSN